MTLNEPAMSPTQHPLLDALAEHWWLFLLRGIFGIVFGLMAMIWPGLTIITLTLLWGAYSLVDGAASLWAAVTGRSETRPRWWLAVVGVLGVAAGIIALLMPGFTAGVLLIFIAIWAILIGVFQIIGAIRLRKEIEGEWLLGLSGLAAIVFGVLFFVQPVAGALAVVWLISFFALFFGVNLVLFAFKLRNHGKHA